MNLTNPKETKNMNDETTIEKNVRRPVTPEEVYENKGLIIEVGKRLGMDHDSCMDLVQDVAVKCWNNRHIGFDPSKGTLQGYLARIARNAAIDTWRKNRHNAIPIEEKELVLRLENNGCHIDRELARKEIRALIDRGIEILYKLYPSKNANDAFVMRFIEDVPTKAIMATLGVDEGFVNTSVHRCLKRLATIISQLEREDN